MMKLRETDQINDGGVHLARVVEVSDEHGKAILDLQASRGYTAWEEVSKNTKVNATLYPEPVAEETAEPVAKEAPTE